MRHFPLLGVLSQCGGGGQGTEVGWGAAPDARHRVSTEVTFGRGDLSVCPLGSLQGPRNILSLFGGVSPRGAHRGKH